MAYILFSGGAAPGIFTECSGGGTPAILLQVDAGSRAIMGGSLGIGICMLLYFISVDIVMIIFLIIVLIISLQLFIILSHS